MFQYVLNNYLKKNLNSSVLGFYGKKEMAQHNGLELNKAFKNIKLPKQSIISNFYVLLNKIKNKLSGNNQVLKRDSYDENKIIYDGYWHDLKFFDEETIDLFEFNNDIGSINVEHINKFSKYNSISVHIRRGDYMNNASVYGNICTKEYYEKAIHYFNEKFENNFFVFFSDDIIWVKENFNLSNALYIDNNKKDKSYIDMYLMSKCNHNIIANSSFSWWGAYLNRNKNKTVIMPSKWYNEDINTFKLFIDNWIKL